MANYIYYTEMWNNAHCVRYGKYEITAIEYDPRKLWQKSSVCGIDLSPKGPSNEQAIIKLILGLPNHNCTVETALLGVWGTALPKIMWSIKKKNDCPQNLKTTHFPVPHTFYLLFELREAKQVCLSIHCSLASQVSSIQPSLIQKYSYGRGPPSMCLRAEKPCDWHFNYRETASSPTPALKAPFPWGLASSLSIGLPWRAVWAYTELFSWKPHLKEHSL